MDVPIGERISRWRESRNLTRTQLAALVEVSLPAVIQWENGDTVPTTANVGRIADALAGSVLAFYRRVPPAKKKAS